MLNTLRNLPRDGRDTLFLLLVIGWVVLPPRSRGPLAVLDAARSADVIFLAHRGFDGAVGALDLLRGVLIGRAIELKTWRVRRADVPREREACLAWLDTEWARVDAWISSRIASEQPA